MTPVSTLNLQWSQPRTSDNDDPSSAIRGGLMSLDFITDSGYDVVTGQNTADSGPQLGCSYFLYL
jgi:hypothetical protein